MKFPVFDLHCDTSNELIEGKSLLQNDAHIDLARAGELPGYAQCFACFTTTSPKSNPVDVFEKKMVAILRELGRNCNQISQAYSAAEISENQSCGKMSAILTIEGPAGFGFDPVLLEDLYKVGFRMSTLGWNEKTPLTGSNKTGGGLTHLGREYVTEAQRLGIIIDVSHISDEGFWDIINITQAPIVASHSNSRAVFDHSRNLTDDMFRAICSTGGVAGINLYPGFLGGNMLDKACDHVLHFLEIDPEGKHIALGGDLDGIDVLPEGFNGVQDYSVFAEKLLSRGLNDALVMNIFWNNAMEVFRKCCI